MKKIIIEREFYRQAGPRCMYGHLKIAACFSTDFIVTSLVDWPVNFEKIRYENSITRGIEEALKESGYNKLLGHFWIIEVKFSKDNEANVPFAYGEAARQAALSIIKIWPKVTEIR